MTRCVLAWLEQSARRAPQAVALEDEQSTMTYAQLLSRARQIGSHLLHRAVTGAPVLVYMDKGPECVAAMLGAVCAGCFYTPLDTSMPEARVERILSQLRPQRVLCAARYASRLRALAGEARVDAIEEIGETEDAGSLAAVRREMIDTDLLYVLFTSGSTGTPKGVSISHRAVVDFIDWAAEALAIPAGARIGNQAPLYFDNSVLDIYGALRAGACVHFIPNRHFLFPAGMGQYLRDERIDTIFWVPSALTAAMNAGALERCAPPLERVFFCGEVMPCKTLNAWRRACPEARFVNMYGPTEITDVCTWFPVEREFADTDALPIGFACANTRVTLVEGEICVSGTCLSSGYYNDPERTREAFVPSPRGGGVTEWMYKTGDLGAYNERGELMFLGRRDSQIKRHGYRIELGEIECALCALEDVRAGCCLYDAPGERIVAFYAGEGDERSLRRALRQVLPKYMLPDVFLRKDALPATGNGKIDRMALKREWEHEHTVR